MKRNSISAQNSNAFPSPDLQNSRESNGGMISKGWSSERVPLPPNTRRQVNANSLMPFNSGRALPSKWEDAERWITSPVSGANISVQKNLVAQARRPKSKSGPLGNSGVGGCYSSSSPAMPLLDGRSSGNFLGMMGSPFSAGVMFIDGMPNHCGFVDGGRSSHLGVTECALGRTSGVHGGFSDLWWNSPLYSPGDEKLDGIIDDENVVSPVASRRDMATQMSPKGSPHTSPKGRSQSRSPPSILPAVEPHSDAQMEVRDVQVDKRVTVIRWSKKQSTRQSRKGLGAKELDKGATEASSSSLDITEAAKDVSKIQREEAKITAWENLQKAKAEAEIRKLEVKLEKERSSSMDKILNKLKLAELKAQDMRNSLSATQASRAPRTNKILSFYKRVQIGSLRGCFSSRASKLVSRSCIH
ncbi:Remorin, C-terminal [Dillenia turbinata]|uniref:Remorin, C-terminal n=1 Tax=Dillenia turbinata TaxID=194707 RepID=A0AAN8Z371_9MAGN